MTKEEKKTKDLEAKAKLIKEGHAGVNRQGHVVDLREYPTAVPIKHKP